MTIEDQIAALIAKAEPLRVRDEKGELGAIVDQINALRALQAEGFEVPPPDGPTVMYYKRATEQLNALAHLLPASVEGQDAPKRRGRPPKAAS